MHDCTRCRFPSRVLGSFYLDHCGGDMFQLGGFVHQTVLLGTPERKRRVLMNRNKPRPTPVVEAGKSLY